MMKKYLPSLIEKSWQERWAEAGLYTTDLSKANKYYVMAEFAYPSGDIHMGHWFTFVGADIYARFKKMQGYQVFFPNGFDAFGLPAENAAIKRNIHPQDWTFANIERMKEQFRSMGASFTFDHEVITCQPEYYRWNQWIFLQMYQKDLAYQGTALANWCSFCQTVLANEGVEAGRCWRCGTEVVQKQVSQWFFRITAYADRLIWNENPEVNWPKPVQDAQNNWIGRSEGALIKFKVNRGPVSSQPHSTSSLEDSSAGAQRGTPLAATPNDPDALTIEVFTTRPDTIFGATFVVVSPEYSQLEQLIQFEKEVEVREYVEAAVKKSELERKESKVKTGVFTGSYVINPMTGTKIPVWVADYVLSGYGTGAIMAVPAHDQRDFEFAQKYELEIKMVIKASHPALAPLQGSKYPWGDAGSMDSGSEAGMTEFEVYEGEGKLINSGSFNGIDSNRAKEAITNYLEQHQLGKKQVQYHLRDWSISRQRYWGTPIPMIHCEQCGLVPVPEEDLPVELPYDVDYQPKGKSPLATNEAWLNVTCPKCGGKAVRDPDTMDTFVDSSWYFFRYLDPKYNQAPFDQELAKKIMPVDIYFGGAEHTLGHTLYSRFFTKFFHDLGLTDLEEYAQRRINHGIVLGPDGNKMSKSKGNVVNPDEEVKKYGADAVRVHLAFFMPYTGTGSWVSERIWGPYHFLERVWEMADKLKRDEGPLSPEDLRMMHKTIKKVGEEIENISFNTAVAAMMEWLNYLSRKTGVSTEEYKVLLKLLAPFAPHITEELWALLGEKETLSEELRSIHQQSWPEFDNKHLEQEEVTIVIQVNGKVRDNLMIQKDLLDNKKDIEKMALERPKVQKFLEGKAVKNSIYVRGKILSLVLSD